MGFGLPSRTTIFDYAGVPAYQRWTNQGKFDGAMLSSQERKLREYYRRVLVISASQIAMQGEYVDLHKVNIALNGDYDETLFAYSRFHPLQQMVVVSNFAQTPKRFELMVPLDVIEQWGVNDGRYQMTDLLTGKKIDFVVENQKGHISMGLGSLQSMVLSLAQ